ncbi:MAG: hypothetical protein AAF368_18390, partial [Planctomycetota bacterium]
MRDQGRAEPAQIFLAASLLANRGDNLAAAEWVAEIPLDGTNPDVEARAVVQRAELLSRITELPSDPFAGEPAVGGGENQKTREALLDLARLSLERYDGETNRHLAFILTGQGLFREAASLVSLARRKSENPIERSAMIAQSIRIERAAGKPWSDLGTKLETFLQHVVYKPEVTPPWEIPKAGSARSNVARFISDSLDDEDQPGFLAALRAAAVPERNRWIVDLLLAAADNELEPCLRRLESDLPFPVFEEVLETASQLGDVGAASASIVVRDS